MTIQRGDQLLLKVGDGGTPTENFTTVAGLRTTRMGINNQSVDVSTKDSAGKWRELLSGAGIKSMSVSGSGIFTDATSEETVRVHAFAGSVNNYELAFGNGDVISGAFQITSYERSGDYNGEESYALTLESAGEITFTPAA